MAYTRVSSRVTACKDAMLGHGTDRDHIRNVRRVLQITRAIKGAAENDRDALEEEEALAVLEQNLKAELEAERLAKEIVDSLRPYLVPEDPEQIRNLFQDLAKYSASLTTPQD